MMELIQALNIKQLKKQNIIKNLKIIEKEEYNKGQIDSIKFCIDGRFDDQKLNKIFNLLVKAF